MVRTVEEIEKAVAQLPPEQLNKFPAWDEQIEQDILAGRLDALADAAIADHRAGKSKKA